ncbi:Nucleotidylyl transferase [Coccomyxa subellipsoidea C-169]|uniref:Nicotinamide-nucleotide adenylyltransferase n=1 Tax=Coccomyxa subellipsoidea (strain C-169) TaxID=574566 RepID=I0YPG4_COCSC|nr:Nucleotidylyl transferase [Coccomyxa subellipsoidea C-169]EIE20283.1 Nucleotidylyl transferase [Coccomyxa subellipsoidea C-169]|eukprot:XP_005644827.1 Nucleotidylyl transferase [Coccomyxa subellipsoidea C-169]
MFPALRRVSAATLAGFSCYHLCLSPAYYSAADTSCEGAVPGKVLQGLASPSEPSWLAWGRSLLGVSQTSSLEVPTVLPTDKLTCKRRNHQPGTTYKPVVLLSCGSFNPPTYAHLRMFELAAQELTKAGYDVLGGYMSPVHDAYSKKGLAPAEHRVAMCELAAGASPLIMVDSWEAAQKQYQYSLHVLQHLERAVNDALDARHTRVRSMLLCGADMVESLTVPGVWRPEHVRHILQDHGLVCIGRIHSDVRRLMEGSGSVLHEFAHNIVLVEDPIVNEISSTKIRSEMCQGHTVRYLLPDAVVDYIQKNELYCSM